MSALPPELWRRVDAVLDEVLELSGAAREERLRDLTHDDPQLRREVELILAEDDESRGPLDVSISEVAARVLDEPAASTPPGRRIGAYRVLGELGRGGMGEVLLAERADGAFEQRVALKIVHGGAVAAARFEQERRLLARLRHPNIAALYDGGTTEDGVPYLAMELVEGVRITEHCNARGFGVESRLALFDAVCLAVGHAHRNLVVHRDLKPSNILVTSEGAVKLLDFGIAKLLDPEGGDGTTTHSFLTPAYASPEQILGEPTSTATDVYSLGVLLYELLAGQNPHGDTSRSRSVELARSIVENEPRPASETAPASLRRRLRGDLDSILGKTLRKNPEERYASVDELRADLERHRRSLPIAARPASRRERAEKFVRRHRLGVGAAAAVAAALAAGVGGVVWQARVAAQERDRAREEAARAGAVKDYLLEVFSSVDPTFEAGASLTALQLAERGAARLGSRFREDPLVGAEIAHVLGKVLTSLAAYERADSLLSSALESHRAAGRHDRVVEALLDRAEAARWRGDHDAAGRAAQEAVATAVRNLSSDDAWIARSHGELAVVRMAQGNRDEAESQALEAIRLVRTAQDPARRIERDLVTNLATILHEAGHIAAAESTFRVALEIDRAETSADGTLSTANILGSLADVLDDLDRLEEAEAAGREALSIAEREYGAAGHPVTGIILTNLAGTVRRLDRLQEAESLQVRAGEVFKAHLGEDHYMLARLYNNLSITRSNLGNLAGAESLQTLAIRIMRKQLGDRHSALLGPMTNRGSALFDLGRLDEAEAQYREAYDVACESLGKDHVQTTYSMLGLAGVLRKTGRFEEAERFARAAWRVREASVGRGHSSELFARITVAAVLRDRGDVGGARALLDGAIADARTGLPATQSALDRATKDRAGLGD